MTDLALNAPGRGWLDRTTGFFDGMARWSAVGLLLGVPTSIALVNISILFLLIGWVFSGRWQRKWAALKASPLTLPVVLLSLWMLLGVAWTEADRKVVGSHLYVYSKLPLMLVLLTLFDEARGRQRAGCLGATPQALRQPTNTTAMAARARRVSASRFIHIVFLPCVFRCAQSALTHGVCFQG